MIKIIGLVTSFLFTSMAFAQAQNAGMSVPGVAINFGNGVNLVDSLEVIILFTILSLAPAFIILCTSFTRIVVVLAFTRQAIGAQNMPPNQVLIGLSMFLTIFVMGPTGVGIYDKAIQPYLKEQMTMPQSLKIMESDIRTFMQKYTRKSDIALFYDVTNAPKPQTVDDVPTYYLIPAFIISELKTAFQIGFLLYIPFLILDMIVASVLMAMGMMMLPPVVVSLPFKLLLFVLVDGWHLVTGAILRSF